MKFVLPFLFLIFPLTILAQENNQSRMYIQQVAPDSFLVALQNELSGIKTFSALTKFMGAHAATCSDFDTLYARTEGKPCPPNFTSDLLQDKLNKYPVRVNTLYAYLLYRNFQPLMLQKKPTEWKRSDYLLLSDWFQNFNRINEDTLLSSTVSVYDLSIIKYSSSYKISDTSYFQKGADLKEGISKNAGPIMKYYFSEKVAKLFDAQFHIEYYDVSGKIIMDGSSPGASLESNLRSYIHAQVFTDIIFMKINNRMVWFDTSP